jgi:cytochrome c oxidase subunit 2
MVSGASWKSGVVALASVLAAAQSSAGTFMPARGTQLAYQVDAIYTTLLVSSFISFVLLVGGMCYFVWKYRRRSANDKTAYITHNHTLEFVWSFIPFLIFIGFFVWGWKVYHDMRVMPEDAIEIHVFAKKWDWRFVYKNGRSVTSQLGDNNQMVPATMVVPVGKPVKLIMTSLSVKDDGALGDQLAGRRQPASEEASTAETPKLSLEEVNKARQERAVLHSFFVPAFRIKQDVVPGRYTSLWFKADKPGDYWVFCTEYCGTGHSAMKGLVKAVSFEEYENWLAGREAGSSAPQELSLAGLGRKLYAEKACIGCHSVDGSPMTGPTWKGAWGAEHVMKDGSKVKVDENYVRESILNPTAKIVKGYENAMMPTYAGQLSDADINAIIEFMKTLK